MTRSVLLVILVLLGGCAATPTPPQPAARSSQRPAAGQLLPTGNSEWEARAKEQRDAQMAQAVAQRSVAEDAPRRAEVQLAERQQAMLAEAKAKCEASREARASDAQGQALEYVAFTIRVRPHLKSIQASCDLKNTIGTRVEVEHAGANAAIVRTRQVGEADKLVCSSGRPGGLSEDDIKRALYLLHAPEQVGAERVVSGGTVQDLRCTGFDAEVGLNADVTKGDEDGIKRLLKWKAPERAPQP